MSAVHLDRGNGSPLCPTTNFKALSRDSEEVTCRRCQHLAARKVQEHTEQVVASVETPAEQAIRFERNTTVRECIEFLKEGDRSAAQYRLTRGFERQVRLAGLERIVREAGEKESA